MRRRQSASCHHTKTRTKLLACFGIDNPRVGCFVERHCGNTGFKADVWAQVVTIGNVIEIALDFGLRREVFAPFPFLFKFRIETKRILKAWNIAPSSGIAVPEPRAANAARTLKNDHTEPTLAEHFQRVETRHSRANHDHVSVQRYVVAPHCCSPELFRLGTSLHESGLPSFRSHRRLIIIPDQELNQSPQQPLHPKGLLLRPLRHQTHHRRRQTGACR